MAEELAFKDEAAAEYDRAFAHVTAHFMPFLLRAATSRRDRRKLSLLRKFAPDSLFCGNPRSSSPRS